MEKEMWICLYSLARMSAQTQPWKPQYPQLLPADIKTLFRFTFLSIHYNPQLMTHTWYSWESPNTLAHRFKHSCEMNGWKNIYIIRRKDRKLRWKDNKAVVCVPEFLKQDAGMALGGPWPLILHRKFCTYAPVCIFLRFFIQVFQRVWNPFFLSQIEAERGFSLNSFVHFFYFNLSTFSLFIQV